MDGQNVRYSAFRIVIVRQLKVFVRESRVTSFTILERKKSNVV